jgi:hypothetical protein
VAGPLASTRRNWIGPNSGFGCRAVHAVGPRAIAGFGEGQPPKGDEHRSHAAGNGTSHPASARRNTFRLFGEDRGRLGCAPGDN